MKNKHLSLNKLPIGKIGTVSILLFRGNCRRRMLDLGLVKGTKVEAVQKSPSGDPIAYAIRGAIIALRNEDASKIIVEY